MIWMFDGHNVVELPKHASFNDLAHASAQREFNNPRICFWAAKREKLITQKYQRLQYPNGMTRSIKYNYGSDFMTW